MKWWPAGKRRKRTDPNVRRLEEAQRRIEQLEHELELANDTIAVKDEIIAALRDGLAAMQVREQVIAADGKHTIAQMESIVTEGR